MHAWTMQLDQPRMQNTADSVYTEKI